MSPVGFIAHGCFCFRVPETVANVVSAYIGAVLTRIPAVSRFLWSSCCLLWLFLVHRFGVDALSVMQLMVQAQASGLDDDDPTRVYMLRAWVRIW